MVDFRNSDSAQYIKWQNFYSAYLFKRFFIVQKFRKTTKKALQINRGMSICSSESRLHITEF